MIVAVVFSALLRRIIICGVLGDRLRECCWEGCDRICRPTNALSRGGSMVMITHPDFIAIAQQSLELIIPSLFGARAALDQVEPGDLELVIETLEGVANSLSVVCLALELASKVK
jgi:hypothetical protein